MPFNVNVPAHEQDRGLTKKLQDEALGILRWLVEGCRSWLQDGLLPPDGILVATTEWRDELNPVKHFVDECCIRISAAKTRSGTLYHAYRRWAEAEGEEVLSQNVFGARLRALNFTPERTNAGRFSRGLGLTSDLPE